MVIRNKDGSVYKPSGTLQQTNTEDQSHELFNKYDQELFQLGGSPILYYEVIIPKNKIDPLRIEARDKLFATSPIELYTFYDPMQSRMNAGLFGIDGPSDTISFFLNYRDTLEKIGHLPLVGSRLYTPHLGEDWEITDRKLADFQKYKVYHLQIDCQKFQETLTTQDGKVTKRDKERPTFDID